MICWVALRALSVHESAKWTTRNYPQALARDKGKVPVDLAFVAAVVFRPDSKAPLHFSR